MDFLNKNKSGFTLIEILISTFIIITLSILVLASYESADRQLALKRAAHKLVQDLRETQEMAMSGQETESGLPSIGGYGIYFKSDDAEDDFYIRFADMDAEGDFDPGEEVGDPIYMEDAISIFDILDGSGPPPVSYSETVIIFVPPDPTVKFSFDSNSATIVLGGTSDLASVRVNVVGLISIEPVSI